MKQFNVFQTDVGKYVVLALMYLLIVILVIPQEPIFQTVTNVMLGSTMINQIQQSAKSVLSRVPSVIVLLIANYV